MIISYYAFGAFSIVSIPVFGIGIYTSIYRNEGLKLPVWLIGFVILSIIGGGCYIATKSTIALHLVLNMGMMILIISTLVGLSRHTPKIALPGFVISATFVLYLVHHKILTLMVSVWGYISLTNWLLVTIVIIVIITYLKKLLHI